MSAKKKIRVRPDPGTPLVVSSGYYAFDEGENLFSPKYLTIDPSEVFGAWEVLSQDTTTLEISHYPESLHKALMYVLRSRSSGNQRERKRERARERQQ